MHANNDYDYIKGGGASRTIAGSKIAQGNGMDRIRKLRLKNTLNEVKVTDESTNRGTTPNALPTFMNSTFRGSPRFTYNSV